MVRPRVARGFRRSVGCGSCINVSGLTLERHAPGHRGYQRAWHAQNVADEPKAGLQRFHRWLPHRLVNHSHGWRTSRCAGIVDQRNTPIPCDRSNGRCHREPPLSHPRLRLLRSLIQTPPSSLAPVTGAMGTTANARLQNITKTETDFVLAGDGTVSGRSRRASTHSLRLLRSPKIGAKTSRHKSPKS
jgi:hypothetical protein